MSRSGTADDAALPEGWEWAKFGDHFEFKNGLNKAKHFFGHGTPIINYMDVYRHPWLLPSQVSGKVSVTRTERQAYSAMQHDAFFTRTSETVAEIGMCSVLMGPIDRAVFSGFVLRGRPVGDGLLPGFAAYAFRSRMVREQIESSATYTTRALTNGRSLSAVNFALPPKPEQQRITATLRDIDDLIASLDRIIAKKQDIKRGAMQQLLTGKTRLPGFSKVWRTTQVSAIGRFLKGKGIRRDEALSGDIPCVRYGEIYTIHEDVVRHFESYISADVAQRATRLQCGDLLFAGSGETKEEIGKCVAFVDEIEAYAGGDIIILRPNWGDPLFLGYLLNAPHVVRQKANRGQGDAVVHISAGALAAIKSPMPEPVEQSAIAEVLIGMDEEIATLVSKRSKSAQLREGMMQQLLSGKVRLT